MNSSSHKVSVLFTVATAAIAGSMGPTTAAQSALSRESLSPNWEHIRTIGGRLGVPRTIALGEPPLRSVAIGDVDGDGHVDLVFTAGPADPATVLRGDGLGGFLSAIVAARSDWATVTAVMDADGIGYLAESSVVAASTTVRAASAASSASVHPATHRAIVADFDNDGAVDVAAAEAGSSSLLLSLGRHAAGSRLNDRIVLARTPTALASGDFDGDGAIDLVVADGTANSVEVLFGDGRGRFAGRRSIDVGITAAADGLGVGDIDGDRLADLVVVGEQPGEARAFLSARGSSLALPSTLAVHPSSPTGSTVDANGYEGIAALTLDPATIAGGSGATSTGTITLNAAAPAGGVVVTLASSNPELAASAPTIVVPAGASTATFVIGTNRNYRRYSGLAFDATISATHGTTTRSAVLSVTAQPRPGTLSSFDAQNEGQMCFGVGVRQGPEGITLEFGSAGNLFDCVPPPNPTGQDGTCTFRQECAFGCERRPPVDGFRFSDVCATTGPYPIAVNPKLVVGGNPSVASLQLDAPAPANSSGVVSSQTVLANTIPNISAAIPAGATIANADVLTARVNTPAFAPIDASYYTPRADGAVGGRLGLTWVALVPGAPPPFRLTSFDFDPIGLTSVAGGAAVLTFARMNQVAPAPEVATATMTLSSSHPAVASFAQPDVAFTQGSSSLGAFVQTHAVAADTNVTLSATVGSTTLTRQLTVRATPPATQVNSFFLDPFDVQGGDPSTGLVVLNGAAPSGGAAVTLVSSNTAVATMPPSVTVPAGSDRVSFTIATSPVSANTNVTLNANFNGTWAATTLIVTAAPGAATLAALAVSPTTVTGGNGSTGTVTLSAAASGSGAVVNLSRSGTAASVPATVTVPAGSQSATFGITTSAVASTTAVTITATLGGTSRSATLTVTAASQSTTPPAPTLQSPANAATVTLPVTLDWSDVTGAASYQIQVDDSSEFSAPRVIDQIVTASQFTASSLAARQHWWRVRGRNSAGTAGPWSAIRTFTPEATAPPPGATVTLTVTATGRSGERVTSSPAGINVSVGSTGSAPFTAGVQITLSVSNSRDAIWSGACSSGGNKTKTCTFTISANASVNPNVQ